MRQGNINPEKNQQLIEERGISFEEVIFYLPSDGLLDDIRHPNQETYSHQRIFIVEIEGYAYLVPYVESDKDIFLKTIIPSRKATKQIREKTMSKAKLDEEEKKLLKAYEAGEFKSVLTSARKNQIRESASSTFKKDKRINIRISSRDLDAIQKRALVEGIPYQTLVSSILHKYVSGSLRDITANKALQTDAAKPRR